MKEKENFLSQKIIENFKINISPQNQLKKKYFSWHLLN